MNGSQSTDNGFLNVYCLECSEMLRWRKEHLVRDDGYYNWRIVPFCKCGEVTDPEIMALARAAYDAASVDDVFHMQEAAMQAVIGPELHETLNAIAKRTRTRFTRLRRAVSLVRDHGVHNA